MIPKKEWIHQWMQKRKKLSAEVDLELYFSQEELGGKELEVVRAGLCPVPTGEMMARDPVCYLHQRQELPYFVPAPVGKYPLELSVLHSPDGSCCAAARLLFNYNPAVYYEQALIGEEEIEEFDGGYYGFFSESGWGCLCDEQVHQAFCTAAEQWQQRFPNGDFGRDFLLPLLEEEELYFIWEIPGTSYQLPFFRTGWGEGQYPVYWGVDREGRICQLVAWFVDAQCEDLPEGEEGLEEGDAFYLLEEDLPPWLTYNGFLYQGEIRLREWEGYFDRDDRYPLLIPAEAGSEEEVLPLCEQLLKNQYRLLDVMMTALTDRYPLMQLEYGHLMSDNVPEMPNIQDKNCFASLLYPQRIWYDPRTDTTAAAFSCTWDEQGGFGAIVRGEQVMELGTADLVPEWEEADLYPENETSISMIADDKKEE